jgi:diguanylate cyclase (GGDEF)-like protein/PAS domain S-box-containing protein
MKAPERQPMARTVIFLLAAAYAITGKLSLLLAVPPGFAAPIFISAGIAIAATTVWGLRALPGVALGSLALNALVALKGDGSSWSALLLALPVMLGSVSQAGIGACLIRRWVQPGIDSGAHAIRFLLLTPAICLINATISVNGLYWLGGMDPTDLLQNWLTWWIGDSIGILLGAPLTWIFVGRPRVLWRRRRWLVGLPLCLASAAVISIYLKTSQWEQQRQTEQFRFKSQQVGDMFQSQFSEHERFLSAMATVVKGPTLLFAAADFREMAHAYLDSRPELRSMGWAPRISAQQRNSFEQWAQQAIDPDYHIRRVGAGKILGLAPNLSEHYPIAFLAPLAGNQHALGLDFSSEPVRLATLARTIASKRPAASEPVTLVQENGDTRGIILLQIINPAANSPHPGPLGVISLVIEITNYLERTLANVAFSGFLARMDDVTDATRPIPMLNTLQRPPQAGDYQRNLLLGGRNYLLTLGPTAAYVQQNRGWQSWIVLVGGMLLTGLLGALMLSISGERAQIQALVRERTRNLREREARLQAILNHAADAILTIAPDGNLVSANAAASRLFGYDIAQMHQLALDRLLPLENGDNTGAMLLRLSGHPQNGTEWSGWHSDGRIFPLSIAVSRVDLQDELFYVCILHDLTEQRRSQEKIYELAHHDPLTGLANRFTLNLRLEQLLALCRRNQSAMAVLFIDLDHFKKINDSHGHQLGDQVLIHVAQRLRELLRDVDTIARHGGDEFIVILGNNETASAVSIVAKRILDALSQPYQLDNLLLHTGASIGISMFPNDSNDATSLLLHADTAMYAAKAQGRNNFQFFSDAMNAVAKERLLLENRLWLALEQHEFELFLQPQIDLPTGRIIGAEALIRWHHPELGLVPPDRFIPIAEESGLMLPLGEWVLHRAIEILADWYQRGLPPLRLALNLSARQCHIDDLLPSIDRLLASSGISTDALELEITESAAMQDPEQTRALLRGLRQRGIKVAIDDFGTGYSSLSYLKLFEIDRIKIDRSFVKDIETDPNDAVIVNATIALAHSLGLEVIAEGVETEAQSTFLRLHGCDEAQGYFFGRPMPLAEFEKFVLLRLQQTLDNAV